MDNLVGVTAEEKLVRLAQGGENELELDRGQVLHLVDHHEIVAGLDQRQVVVAQDVRVVIVVVLHERQIFEKQVIDVRPLILGKDGLPDAQAEVRLPAQIGAVSGRPSNDALEFLK
jgi:hypothetical protein